MCPSRVVLGHVWCVRVGLTGTHKLCVRDTQGSNLNQNTTEQLPQRCDGSLLAQQWRSSMRSSSTYACVWRERLTQAGCQHTSCARQAPRKNPARIHKGNEEGCLNQSVSKEVARYHLCKCMRAHACVHAKHVDTYVAKYVCEHLMNVDSAWTAPDQWPSQPPRKAGHPCSHCVSL